MLLCLSGGHPGDALSRAGFQADIPTAALEVKSGQERAEELAKEVRRGQTMTRRLNQNRWR